MNSVTTRVYSVDFFLAILGYSLFVIMDSIAKELTNYYHVTQIIFINSISALLPILLYTQVRNSWKKIKTKNFLIHLVRAVTIIISMGLFFLCINKLPLTTMYSIIFFTPFVLTIGSVIFLKEKVSWRRYTATIIGFIGAIIAIDPFNSEFSKISLIAIFMPFFPAISYLIVRKYGHQESLFSFLIYGKLFMILFSSVIAFNFYKPMPIDDLMINLSAGVLRGVAIIFVINSARHLPSSIFASAQYIQIIAGGIIGYLVFKDIPSLNIYFGGTLIIGAGLYIILREAQLGVNIVTSTTRHPTIPIKKD